MSEKDMVRLMKRYQRSSRSGSIRQNYLRSFVPKMIYRTTKTENTETTRRMVNDVLNRHT